MLAEVLSYFWQVAGVPTLHEPGLPFAPSLDWQRPAGDGLHTVQARLLLEMAGQGRGDTFQGLSDNSPSSGLVVHEGLGAAAALGDEGPCRSWQPTVDLPDWPLALKCSLDVGLDDWHEAGYNSPHEGALS